MDTTNSWTGTLFAKKQTGRLHRRLLHMTAPQNDGPFGDCSATTPTTDIPSSEKVIEFMLGELGFPGGNCSHAGPGEEDNGHCMEAYCVYHNLMEGPLDGRADSGCYPHDCVDCFKDPGSCAADNKTAPTNFCECNERFLNCARGKWAPIDLEKCKACYAQHQNETEFEGEKTECTPPGDGQAQGACPQCDGICDSPMDKWSEDCETEVTGHGAPAPASI